jgi:chemotaxis protein MotB
LRRASWLACAALVAAGCVTPQAYDAEVARQRALSHDLVSCKRGMLDASRGREKLLSEKAATEAERAALAKQIETQSADLGALADELERERVARLLAEDEIQRTYQGLVESLQAEVKSGQIEIESLKGRLQVRAVDQVLFDSGSAEIKPAGRTVLAKVANGIKTASDREINVQGHTDNVPIKSSRFASNWDLSVARAVNVAKFLASKGVPERQLGATGYGEHRPLASNADAAGRQRNRRIEIVLEPMRE